MADARSRQLWDHTSCLLMMLANVHRDPKRKAEPYTPADFNPYLLQAKRKAKMKVPLTVLKQVFVDQRPTEN